MDLPDSLELKEKRRIVAYINNEEMFVANIKRHSSDSAFGSNKIAVYNKEKEEWNTYILKGNQTNIRSYGKWIAGEVVNGNKYKISSPGIDERNQKIGKYGMPFDVMANRIGIRYSGELFLINIDTKEYYLWDTKQGDSEILFFQNKEVVYRVNDNIYKRNIKNNNELSLPVLLIHDEKIPFIHWAFVSGK